MINSQFGSLIDTTVNLVEDCDLIGQRDYGKSGSSSNATTSVAFEVIIKRWKPSPGCRICPSFFDCPA